MKSITNSIIRYIGTAALVLAVLGASTPAVAATIDSTGSPAGNVVVSNFTRDPNTRNWSTTVSANAGEQVSVGIYYHVLEGSGTAQNVVVRLNQSSTGPATSFTFTGTVTSSNSNTISGSPTVTLTSSQTLTSTGVVNWAQNQNGQGSPVANGSNLFGSGLSLGNLPAGSFGTIVARFQVGSQSVQTDPVVTTTNSSVINSTSAVVTGSIDSRGNTISSCSFEFGTTQNLGNSVSTNNSGSGTFVVSSTLTNLVPNTTYFFRPTCTSNGRVFPGTPILSFTTQGQVQNDPVVQTTNPSVLNSTSAIVTGSVDSRGNAMSSCSFEFGTTQNFGNSVASNVGTGIFQTSATLTNLAPNTTYFFRPTCIANGRVFPGTPILSFTTNGSVQNDPIVSTLNANVLSNNSVVVNGSVDSRGNAIGSCFFEFGTTQNFGNSINSNVGSGVFSTSATLTNLAPNTTYFYRPVCTANGRIFQGTPILSFNTQSSFQNDPVVTTLGSNVFNNNSVVVNGSVDTRGSSLSACFFEFGQNQSFNNSVNTNIGSGVFSTSATLNNLSSNTTYFYRLTCISNGRTFQGTPIQSFFTGGQQFQQDPFVTTGSASAVSNNSQLVNGTINFNGSNQNAVCFFEFGPTSSFGNTSGPTSVSGSFNSTFNTVLNNLNSNTTYFYRPFCQVNGRTFTGSPVLSFTTNGSGFNNFNFFNNNAPTVTTNSPTEIFADSARFNGSLTTNGQLQQTSVWFEYGPTTFLGNQTPVTDLGSITGATFSRVQLNLAPNTTYFYRAVAQNSAGQIGRGSILSFTTQPRAVVITPVVPAPARVITPVVQSINSPIILSYGLDNVHPLPGDIVLYRIGWRNDGNTRLTNAILRVSLPGGVTYLDSKDGVIKDGNNIVYSVGNLPVGAGGAVFFRALIDRSIPLGSELSMGIRMDFFNPLTSRNGDVTITGLTRAGDQVVQPQVVQPQQITTAVVTTTSAPVVSGTPVQNTDNSANLFGAGNSFFPQTAIGWLGLLALVVLIVVLIVRYFGKSN